MHGSSQSDTTHTIFCLSGANKRVVTHALDREKTRVAIANGARLAHAQKNARWRRRVDVQSGVSRLLMEFTEATGEG
jgi:hypothetical protein